MELTLAEAIEIVHDTARHGNLQEALTAIVAQTGTLDRRVYFTVPAAALDDASWEPVIEGSEPVGENKRNRMIMPGAPRVEFSPGDEVIVTETQGACFVPINSFLDATVAQMQVVRVDGVPYLAWSDGVFEGTVNCYALENLAAKAGTDAGILVNITDWRHHVYVARIMSVGEAEVRLQLDSDIEAKTYQCEPVDQHLQEACPACAGGQCAGECASCAAGHCPAQDTQPGAAERAGDTAPQQGCSGQCQGCQCR